MVTSTIITIPDIYTLSDADGKFEIELLRTLSLTELRESEIGKGLLYQQDWYDDRPRAQAQIPAGKYAVRLPIPGSNNRTREGQGRLLLPGEKRIPIVFGVLTLLGLHKAGKPDPLNGGWIRCAERFRRGVRAAIVWRGGRLLVGYFFGDRYQGYDGRLLRGECRYGNVWAGGVRTS